MSFLKVLCRFDKNGDTMAKDEFSGLRRAYAEATGVSIRTAQRHQKGHHPDWQRFIGATAIEGAREKKKTGEMSPVQSRALAEVSPLRPGDRPAFYEISDTDLSPVQIKEKQAWELHYRTYEQWAGLTDGAGTSEMAVVLLNQLPKLRENHEKAQQAREKWEVEQRMVIQAGEFEQFSAQFILPLAEMLRNVPTELAAIVNPGDPSFAREKLIRWLREKAQPQIKAMLEGADEFLVA